ncbi:MULTISPECIES: DHA2 family efflux MFS transporter permease subunit [Acidithiobacillus]|uniref:DHA2 family efflux MFS transporter permease subunit n=1 Tax=Acidithiobacillus ferruginosus TaxID=3063951 RepID=A0ACD5IGP2_9PROT|nr:MULTISPECIES: DHA2 family efflux MFS transporter permease subunit [Acidithiobacillus]MBU2815605.1 DHA2 family efflux MFS transporter permease subunit [Acidithiobacillus ferruginosus]MBU2857741.1 DHA2 family efflux MFS transporter permease subunit [Acidithiobacillus ferrooxidans]MBU2862055.1 DHA2 family efflux MFS transporter permease subunit [Acidithiobacillus ferrooxidans]UEP60100.1 DHA2 family efflux MFS transporter permease subunit [Acidithiobacillus ferriphilus]
MTVESAAVGAEGLNRPLITLSIMLATIMQTLDSTIANVALPHMQGSLSVSLNQIGWVLTSYIVATAIATPLTGWLCDRFGQRTVFLASVLGFTLASMWCGISTSLGEIVVARVMQGVFGAALVPLSQTVLLDINPREKQGSAMALWGMGVMVGPIVGPTLGGWLTDTMGWRWVFFINVPVGIMAFTGIWKSFPRDSVLRRMHFDMAGFVSLSLAIGALQLLLDRGQEQNWFASVEIWIEAYIAGFAALYFIYHTRRTPFDRSFFDYRLILNRNYVTGLLFIFIVGLVLFASRALIPTMLQDLMGYTAMTAGWVTAPSGLGTMFAMLIVGRLVGKVDLRLLLAIGFGITAFSLWQMQGYSLVIGEGDVIWPGVWQGLGIGLVFVPLSTATFATLSPEMRANGTAIYSLVRNVGSSIGISLVETLLTRNTQIAHAALSAHINDSNPGFQNPAVASLYNPHNAMGQLLLNTEITRQATMIAYIDDFWLMLVMTLAVFPLLLIIRSPKRGAAVEQTVIVE